MTNKVDTRPPLVGLAAIGRRTRWLTFLAVLGPGLVVMLADTDVGSIVTAAQSGTQWGYKLLLLQFILIPILYLFQQLPVRLPLFTDNAHAHLISATFRPLCQWI